MVFWVEYCEISKNLIKIELIDTIHNVWQLMIFGHTPHVCVGGWMGGLASGFMSNLQK